MNAILGSRFNAMTELQTKAEAYWTPARQEVDQRQKAFVNTSQCTRFVDEDARHSK